MVTGCRYGELTRMRASDFNAEAGTITVRETKAGKPRHVVLADEGRALFAELTAGRAGRDLFSSATTARRGGLAPATSARGGERARQDRARRDVPHPAPHLRQRARHEGRSDGRHRRATRPCRHPHDGKALRAPGAVLCRRHDSRRAAGAGDCRQDKRCGRWLAITLALCYERARIGRPSDKPGRIAWLPRALRCSRMRAMGKRPVSENKPSSGEVFDRHKVSAKAIRRRIRRTDCGAVSGHVQGCWSRPRFGACSRLPLTNLHRIRQPLKNCGATVMRGNSKSSNGWATAYGIDLNNLTDGNCWLLRIRQLLSPRFKLVYDDWQAYYFHSLGVSRHVFHSKERARMELGQSIIGRRYQNFYNPKL